MRARSLALTAEADRFVEVAGGWIRNHHDVASELRGADVSLAVQTAVTAAPLDAERLGRYLVKAAREADLDTGWIEPDREYETRLETLAAAVSAETAAADSPIGLLAARLRDRGSSIGLRLLLLQLTVPGVPDLYQGSPMELLSLVDPDNRRPPDWARLARVVELASAQTGPVEAFDRGVDDERVDLARSVATRRILDLRRRRPEAFGRDAGYRPIVVDGPAAASVIAFERVGPPGDRGVAATVALRASASPGRLDGTTLRLPGGRWHGLLAGQAIRVGDEPTPVTDVVGVHGVDVLERLGD